MAQRHLLANPAAPFSVQKFYDALRSQGVAVGKDTLHAYLGYRKMPLNRPSLCTPRRNGSGLVNPRKGIRGSGLIPLYESTGRPNLAHASETAVLVELERRGYEDPRADEEGFEVDFLARAPGQSPELIQVCLDISDNTTQGASSAALAGACSASSRRQGRCC